MSSKKVKKFEVFLRGFLAGKCLFWRLMYDSQTNVFRNTITAMERILISVVILLLALSACAGVSEPRTTGVLEPYTTGFQFKTVNNDSVIITGFYGTAQTLIIPDRIQGLPVTAIGDRVFYEKTNLTSVMIPPSVTSIGNSAFAGTGLMSVTIP